MLLDLGMPLDGADKQKRHAPCKSKGRASFACSSSWVLGVADGVSYPEVHVPFDDVAFDPIGHIKSEVAP